MFKPIVIPVLIGSLVACHSTAAADTRARVANETRLLAGPSPDLPVVAELRAGTDVSVQGCLDDFSWCDVAAEQARGWLDAGDISGPYQGSIVTVRQAGAGMGIGVVEFDLLTYWAQHYSEQPWYEERERWARRRWVNRPHWPQFPGQPPINPQPPPPPPPPKPPAQPLMPGPPRP